MDLAQLREKFGDRVAIQGNLDPSVLLASEESIAAAVNHSMRQTTGRGHILNLGHGILPETPVENAVAFIRAEQSAPVENASVDSRGRAVANVSNPASLA
jgi:uroporphyrinogen decarboxylase